MPRCIGLDVGSSSLKAGLLNLETGRVERVVSAPFPAPQVTRPGGYEIDAVEVTNRCRTLIASLLRDAPDCRRMVTCGQMGGLILVDGRGHARTPYYSWRDLRSTVRTGDQPTLFEAFQARLPQRDFELIGKELRPSSTIVLLTWLVENGLRPDTSLYPVTVADAVIAGLCETAPGTEPTQALGLLNLTTGQPHAPLFETAGIPEMTRPRIHSRHEPVGTCRIEGVELTCHPAVGDQHAALFAVEIEEGELSVNCSTGSQVSRVTREFRPGDYQIRPYFDGALLNTIAQLPAGRSLNVLVDLLTELARAEGVELKNVWKTIAERSAEVPVEDLDVDLSFYTGPLGHHGHIRNITTENLTAGSLFRAAFANIADNYLLCAQRISAGDPWTRVVLTGGLTNKLAVLREMITSRLEAPVRESTEVEETLVGLLKLARAM